jgi:hypothetical protein
LSDGERGTATWTMTEQMAADLARSGSPDPAELFGRPVVYLKPPTVAIPAVGGTAAGVPSAEQPPPREQPVVKTRPRDIRGRRCDRFIAAFLHAKLTTAPDPAELPRRRRRMRFPDQSCFHTERRQQRPRI